MGRSPCCDELSGVKRGPWSSEEDEKLSEFVVKNGNGIIRWKALPKLAGLNRCGKSCRLRWINYLRPDIKRGNFTQEEESTIIELHSLLGNRWSKIASHFPGRTDNEIKNFWNKHLSKKLIQMGIDPNTHKQRTNLHQFLNISQLFDGNIINLLNSNHLKLQTEIAKFQVLQNLCQLLNTTTNSQLPNITINGPQNPNPNPKPSQLHVEFPTGLGLEGVFGDKNKAKMEMESFDKGQAEDYYTLPPLILKSPSSTSNVNQIEMGLTNLNSPSIFDSLESIMCDESSGSAYWNNILRSTI